jgi:hypothetical protein
MRDTEEMPAGGIGGAAVRVGARRGRGVRRNLKAKLTCFSPVLSGGRIGAPQPQREIGQFESGWEPPPQPSPVDTGEGEPRSGWEGVGIGGSTSGIVL